MKYYWGLRLRMLNRSLVEFGINPIAGYILVLLSFILLSVYLFYKTEMAAYIYCMIAVSLILKLSEQRRNEFLKSVFKEDTYFKVRIVENLIIAAPFCIFMFFYQEYVFISSILVGAVLLAFFSYRNRFNYAIPTPFYKFPFEFIVGFRNAFILFLGSWMITFISISVANFNLGAFSLALIFLISSTFYIQPENEYYVWIFASKPQKFLIYKIKVALIGSSILSAPVLVGLGLAFPDQFLILLIFQILGYIMLVVVILAKYSVFPEEMNIPQVLMMVLCVSFPPLLLAIIPFFYLQSIKKLKEILE